ncbi:MAG: DUF2945 domain-containing protein [Bizionia sp.]|nr:DUF2945 domain-containing protein [Bizionia sp.]
MIRKGTTVQWKWGAGIVKGKVKETYTSTITKTIKGTEVKRHGKSGNKALVIEQDNGDYILKSESEVQRV